jgi:hypothetical protein
MTLHSRHTDPRILKVALWRDVSIANKCRELVKIVMIGVEGDKIGGIDVKINLVQTLAIHLNSTAEGGIQPNVQVLTDLLVCQTFSKRCGHGISIGNEEEFKE